MSQLCKLYFPIFLIALCSSSCGSIAYENGYSRYIHFNGFTIDKASIFKATKSEFATYDIHPREVIADIGFNYGSIEGALLLSYDSLTIYAEDFQTPARNEKIIYKTFEQYVALRPTPNSNKIIVVKGSQKETTLPRNYFDKVIVRKTLHHIFYKDTILDDIFSILKPNGKLYIMEPSTDTTYYDKKCGTDIMGKSVLISLFNKHHFSVISESSIQNNKNDAAPWVLGTLEIPFTIYVLKKNEK